MAVAPPVGRGCVDPPLQPPYSPQHEGMTDRPMDTAMLQCVLTTVVVLL